MHTSLEGNISTAAVVVVVREGVICEGYTELVCRIGVYRESERKNILEETEQ